MPAELRTVRPALLALVVAGLVATTSSLAACGDDDEPNQDAQRDTSATQTTERDGQTAEAEREARAIAEELKQLQRDVARSGRTLVEGSGQRRDAAERDLRAQARRARELAERSERDLAREANGAEELREAARQTERGVAELRRFADEGGRDGLARANEELEAAEDNLRSFAESLRDDAPAEDARRALEDLRQRVPDIPTP